MKKLTSSKTSFRIPQLLRKRWLVILLMIFLVLTTLGAYAWWSKTSWDTYENRFTTLQQNAEKQFEATFSLQSDTQQERQAKLDGLAKLNDEISSLDELCSQNNLIAWQRVIKTYAEQEEACKSAQTSLKSFQGSLKITIEYLQSEHALAKSLTSAPAQAETTEGDWEGQLSGWRSTADSIKNVTSSGKFDSVKQAAVEVSSGIIKAWEEVLATHHAKDKTRYVKATQDLAAAYDRLETITTSDTDQLKVIASDLEEAYKNLK